MRLLRFVFLAGLLVMAFAGRATAQTDDTSLIGRAIDEGQTSAVGELNVSQAKDLPVSQLIQNMNMDVPVISDRLTEPMQQFAQRIIIGFYGFYTSLWWQVTIKSLLCICAFLGIGYHLIQIGSGEANPGTAWRNMMVKLIITATVFASLAPKVPFVLTRAINAMVASFSFDLGDRDVVKYHQQAFLRRALLMQGKTMMVLNGRLTDIFYESSELHFDDNTPLPEDFYPQVQKYNDSMRQVTPMSFIFAGPPALGKNYQKPIPNSKALYLKAPVSAGDPFEMVRPWFGFLPFVSNAPSPEATDNGYEIKNPLTGAQQFIKLRPFTGGIRSVLVMYKELYDKWPQLKQQKKHQQALNEVDAVASAVFDRLTDALIDDVVANQAFALSPPITIRSSPMVDTGTTEVQANKLTPEEAQRMQSFRDFYARMGEGLARDFDQIKKSRINEWTYDIIIPVGLFFCNGYIILCIWLLPTLLSLWACFFLLPPFFELSGALKKGGATIVALPLYPILLQLLIIFCFALADAANTMDNTIDPNRGFAKLAIYGILPSSSTGSASLQVATAAGKTVTVNNIASLVSESNAGITTMVVWIMILLILVGSPAIVAKFIMGIGAADALTQPAQAGATMGGAMASKAVLGGVGSAAGDVAGAASSVSTTLSRRMVR